VWRWSDFFADDEADLEEPPKSITAAAAKARMLAFGARVKGFECRRTKRRKP